MVKLWFHEDLDLLYADIVKRRSTFSFSFHLNLLKRSQQEVRKFQDKVFH